MKHNILIIGSRVKMKDGRMLTVTALEFRHFVAAEESTYQMKNDIAEILISGK